MGSTYGYITVTQLEAYTGIDYGTTKATYTDTLVEAQISIAERVVRALSIDPPTTATDEVFTATMILSERFMRNVMITDGFADEMPQDVKNFMDYIIDIILKKQQGMVDSFSFGRGG